MRVYSCFALTIASVLASATVAVTAPAPTRQVVDLNGNWLLNVETNGVAFTVPASVPGCVHLDLQGNDLIPDPFYGRNELRVQWVEDRDWIYEKRFDVGADVLTRARVDLVCEGLDTIAKLTLNGKEIGSADNMFRRWVFPVREFLHRGSNTLRIEFQSPMDYIDQLPMRRYDGEMPTANDPVGGRSYVRKAQYQFGWDWGPRLVTCGIWRPIYIEATDLPSLDAVTTQQRHHVAPDGSRAVDLEVRMDVLSPVSAAVTAVSRIAGTAVTNVTVVTEGMSTLTLRHRIEDPDLWWPRGYGAPSLHGLDVQLRVGKSVVDERSLRIGFRTVRIDTARDDIGTAMTVVVNGTPVFCKGANWIPCDSFPTRVSVGQYRQLLTDAATCNMNMIRVWGGGIYEMDTFYDLCDELGIMVWQDFMFACGLYPASRSFLENVEGEVRDNIRRLVNHPCIALYCGNNECESAIKQWFRRESTEWQNYRKLFHELLPSLCEELDPGRDYWPASPHSILDADPGKTEDGDCHVWSVWHGAKPLDTYESVTARFVSEFGYQSFPSLRTIRDYAGNDLNLTAPNVEYHQKNTGGNQRILSQMMETFRMPGGFSDFVVVSQLQQAMAMKIGVEHWRRQAPVCMGTLYWQLDDCWPVASWSSIDYMGRWKALQYFSKRFFAPLLLSTTYDEASSKVTLHASVDGREPVDCDVRWQLLTYSGERFLSGVTNVTVQPLTSVTITSVTASNYVDYSELSRGDVVPATAFFTAAAGDAMCVQHLAPLKGVTLPHPKLTVQVAKRDGGGDIEVSTDVFAKWVWLESVDEVGVERFSDNYFDLLPGETRSIRYAGNGSRFKVRSLVDTYTEDGR